MTVAELLRAPYVRSASNYAVLLLHGFVYDIVCNDSLQILHGARY